MPARKPDAATAYARAVKSGRVKAGPYVRLAALRHLRDLKRKDLVWHADRAEEAIEFYAEMLTLEDGSPFELEPFQAFIVGSCFGWYLPDGRRRFRSAYVEIGKGNGKTPLAAGLGLYGLVGDREPASEVYAAATTRDQAKIAYKDAARMVEASPELNELIETQVGSLSIPAQHAVFRPVSSEHRGLDGLRVHIGIVDELHEHPTAVVVDKIRAGTKRRRNALIFEITNSGYDRTSVCWAHHELSVKVLEGTVENDQWFAYVCALDDGDDWQDERTWIKVNPGMGSILPKSYLREQVAEAVGMPSKENIVKRLNFCMWTEQSERWLPLDRWDACPGERLDLDEFRGQRCVMAIDGAFTNDFFASCKLFGPDEDGAYAAVWQFWLPEGSLAASGSGRSEAARLQIQEWARQGWITLTDGEIIDYDVIEAELLRDAAQYDLAWLPFDRWGLAQLVAHLRDALGTRYNPATGKNEDRVVPFPQSMAQMSGPTKELEKLIVAGKLRHGGNPVARWMASNVTIRHGPNAQVKPDRDRSGDKIDGIIALIMALDMTMRQVNRPAQRDEAAVVVW